ncbi:CaiB/BaiF CoA-transferase family protein [uncultured Tistrella sp.]|uniref:CaiB/BaiF CoA transferase family protein n=1 Tax=Tistrella mobilis TaxID=171437 RepID=UPI000C095728|nr:CaiB/BaiF CoA-transferase family protein [uncultured Tistrella sp.]MAM72757.1 carnitine dehydratase [Tistrella sp.]
MSRQGALAHLRIIEMAGLGPCPLAGQLLADLGAEVIVIDRASGRPDPADVNRRNKLSVALNLKSDAGREAALRLIASADALIEGFRPGVMERLGLGPEACMARNPGLVFGRMTGWGQTGPLAPRAGHDLNYMAITGSLAAIGPADGPPLPPLNLVADYGGGSMFLIFGVLAALLERGVSGKGQVVDAAIVDGVPAMMGVFHWMFHTGDWTTQRQNNMLDGGAPYYRCYETADGKAISVGPIEPQFFAELCEKAGLEHVPPHEQVNKANWPRLSSAYADVFRRRTRDEWMEIFEGSDACVAPVLTLNELEAHPHNAARGIYVRQNGVMQAAPAPRFDRTPSGPLRPPQAAGANSADVLRLAGFADEDIAAMQADGTIC